TKGDWEHGLPMLAKGADAALKAAAAKDVAHATDARAMSEVAGQWWDLAEKESQALYKARLKGRATYWYGKALPGLTGLSRALAEKRLGEGTGQAPAVGEPNPSAVVRVKYASGETDLETLSAGVRFFVKPARNVQGVPAELEGLTFSRRPMGATAAVTI